MNTQREHWDRLATHPPDASVIDPLDTRGRKNAYITSLRNQALVSELAPLEERIVLDFGCGTGGIAQALCAAGARVVGVDISMGLLRRTTERGLGEQALFVCYDGEHLPMADASVSHCVTYVVLNHLIEDGHLLSMLRELHRVLRAGGRFIAIEQVRTRGKVDLKSWQNRRTRSEFATLFEHAGFNLESSTLLRYGRMPSTWAVRLGWIPPCFFPALHAFERWIGRCIGVLPWDYSDMRFTLRKR